MASELKLSHKETVAVLRRAVAEADHTLVQVQESLTRLRQFRRDALKALAEVEAKPRARKWTLKTKGRPAKKSTRK